MPVAIKSISSRTNTTVTFDFPDTVVAYVVGVSYWKFSFGGDDHHVRKVALSIGTNKPSANQVTATITATLNDDSGHGISNTDSSVVVSCIAIISAPNSLVSLANADGIKSETSSGYLSLPSNALSIGSAFLSGHSLTQGADHHVKSFQATAGFKENGNEGQISSVADMVDNSGNASEGYINGGLLAASSAEHGILSTALTNQQTTSSQSIDFGRPLAADAAVILQSLVVTFGSKDHHVKTIGGGCSGWKVEGSAVSLNDAHAFITDDSGNTQSNSESSVSLVIFALPAS